MFTLKAPITTAADDIHKYFFIVFQRKKDLMFHMKNQALFSSNDKSKKLKRRLLQFLLYTLRVKVTVRKQWQR